MRKIHRENLLVLADTLISASAGLNAQQGQDLINLCANIQDFTISMFELVDSFLPGHNQLFHLFDSLNKNLYLLTIDQGNTDLIQQLAHDIRNTIYNTKPDHMEIAFFCYKASMSDSLESIYFAAKEDPSCDAYFIPIPYYDKNQDGTFSAIHLEAEGYYSDKYVLTDWQKYDVELRHPDAIFIMNPFDEYNYTTSVHPDYYSSRLKNYTDALVYIEYGLPYHVAKDSYTEEMKKIYTEATPIRAIDLHADYVITYSQELPNGYLSMFEAQPDLARQYSITPEKIQKKYVPLGSPKFDKILHTSKQDCPLPAEWQTKTANKKVVLYNTGLSELLTSTLTQMDDVNHCQIENIMYFNKLKEILDTFQSRDDVILWWRPHPLFESNLQATRVPLYKEYLSIIQKFKDSDKGIFDTTEDVHRAIVWSDAMISDGSSLLLMYTATGKPFYIPSISKKLPEPVYECGSDFKVPLDNRLKNMRAAKGANIQNLNCCIWWDNFLEEDTYRNIHFNNYLERFLNFVLYPEHYPDAEEHRQLQLQMYQDFVVNADGTAGQKIYEYIKKSIPL